MAETFDPFDSDNYLLSKEEVSELRQAYLMGPLREYVRRFLNEYPQLRSVTIEVGQYYNDEASDAVHFRMMPSVHDTWQEPETPKPFKTPKGRLITPTRPNFYHGDGRDEHGVLKTNLPFLDSPALKGSDYSPRRAYSVYDVVSRWEERAFGWSHPLRGAAWGNNSSAIPMFAAYCSDDDKEFNPICVYRRMTDGSLKLSDVAMEFTGKVMRPEMDGIKPTSEFEIEDEDADDEDFFKWVKEAIATCEANVLDPLSEIKEQVRRRDILSREDERYAPQSWSLLVWGAKGPGVQEEHVDRITNCPEALREIQDEWDRRNRFDADFARKYGKK